MKKYQIMCHFIILIFVSTSTLKAQSKEFDEACRIILELHGRSYGIESYKQLIVSDKVKDGDFDIELRLQCTFLSMGTTYVKYFENKKLMKEFGEKTFKDIIPFDPKTSKYYSKKTCKKLKLPSIFLMEAYLNTYLKGEKI